MAWWWCVLFSGGHRYYKIGPTARRCTRCGYTSY